MVKKIFSLLISVLFAHALWAQKLPVGLLENTDDLLRRQQLLGLDSTNTSLMIRPVLFKGSGLPELNKLLWSNSNSKIQIKALPLVLQQQLNTNRPYGINDGAMISAKGYQMLFSAGVYAKIGPLSIQLRPEYVYAQNSGFRKSFEAENPAKLKNLLLAYHNSIDAPEQMGNGSYSKVNWGQSSVRLNYWALSLGLSNENLWWGPGERNSLLMTNNAAGFKHLTLNTTRPIVTVIGDFEGQIIAGRLENSGIMATPVQVKMKDSWRYLSALALSYQPKWVPGLYIGLDRSFLTYRSSMGNKFGDYFPLFSSFNKRNYTGADATVNIEDNYKRDQLFSLFAKWVMPEAKAEIYFQYGKEDHSWDLRDQFVELDHSRAYVAGFRKLIPYLGRDNEFLQVGLELTQMEPTSISQVRGQGNWYSHHQILHGYTNEGQIIGAGIGPDNLQSLNIAWVKDVKRIGLMLERRVHNNLLYYSAFGGTSEPRRHWVDFGFGAKADWDFKHFILNAQATYTKSLNYQYQIEGINPADFWSFDPKDANNFHLKIGALYRF
ncbi:MAG: capsule assembly Wzi family protein [Bacteroidota bacterium]